ncbi:H-NS family nucleoid-associated regulatory protein [Parasedimentitalea maritima]
MTWSDRGRQPAWFKEAVAGGATPDDLEIGQWALR